jgi:hypothetical protein
MFQRNLLPPHFSLNIELVDSSENWVHIRQARLRHIPDVCNIVVVGSKNFKYIFRRIPVSRRLVPVKSYLWLSTCKIVQNSLHPSYSHMFNTICSKHGMNCLLFSVHPSDFPLVPKTKVRKNRIGRMITCGHVNTKYWFGRGSCMCRSVCVSVCVCVCVNFTCMSNQSFCRTSRPRLRH